MEDVNKKFDALKDAESRAWVEERKPPPRPKKLVKVKSLYVHIRLHCSLTVCYSLLSKINLVVFHRNHWLHLSSQPEAKQQQSPAWLLSKQPWRPDSRQLRISPPIPRNRRHKWCLNLLSLWCSMGDSSRWRALSGHQVRENNSNNLFTTFTTYCWNRWWCVSRSVWVEWITIMVVVFCACSFSEEIQPPECCSASRFSLLPLPRKSHEAIPGFGTDPCSCLALSSHSKPNSCSKVSVWHSSIMSTGRAPCQLFSWFHTR